jgi:hypothetical protein
MPAIAKVWVIELTRERALIMAAESRSVASCARRDAVGDEPWPWARGLRSVRNIDGSRPVLS